jgi:hypothetical protein
MKKCSYCGAEYPDDAVICPLDQTPFENVKAGSMGQKHSQRIGSAGYWLIFAGVPIAIIAILAAFTMRNGDIRGVSERALPYVLAFVPVAIVIGSRELYKQIPKRLVIPLGVFGWIIHFVILSWIFGHH